MYIHLCISYRVSKLHKMHVIVYKDKITNLTTPRQTKNTINLTFSYKLIINLENFTV